ncbi:ferrous iron transport protein A [Granulicella cerasi]|uniref:Ferrous iron transport protein A n=1 Tax=Granulicella cerasi TaxID=741063 RepID=A0ABW1ZDI4_9BACT|nr:FeoA family protein [Granulicella cerasi]
MVLLSEVQVGQSGVLQRVDLSEDISDHLAHLGFLPGAEVQVLRRAPAGDPTVYRIDGVEVGLRSETARHIEIELNHERSSVAEVR